MDVKIYFKRIHEIEATLPDEFLVMVSEETDDGGRAGVRTEVPRKIAAKMIVERRARLATVDEAKEFHEAQLEGMRAAEQLAAVNRMEITVVPQRPVSQ